MKLPILSARSCAGFWISGNEGLRVNVPNKRTRRTDSDATKEA